MSNANICGRFLGSKKFNTALTSYLCEPVYSRKSTVFPVWIEAFYYLLASLYDP